MTGSGPPVVTGLDLPADAAGGSVELLYDLYARPDAPIGGQVFMLAAAGNGCGRPSSGLMLLEVPGKCLEGPPFWRYVIELTTCLTATVNPPGEAVAHLQHLAFGASPAQIDAFPELRRIAFVQGTDLLYAGRLTAEKGADRLAAACAEVSGVRLSIAAPTTNTQP